MAIQTLTSSLPISICSSSSSISQKRRRIRSRTVGISGNFSHFVYVVRKDAEFLKNNVKRGIEWANEALRLPQVARKIDDAIWLRDLEDPLCPPFQPKPFPQPWYPELSGVDLLLADLKALEAYASYLYYLTKIWSRPLPEFYDPQEVADYFNCRPHVVALRLLEVFSSFAVAAIRIRASEIRIFNRSSTNETTDGNNSQHNFGMVLKETMLNLGPTFIKVGQSLSTRPDIIGSEISKALSELHDQIPPFPRAMAMKIIEDEFGSPVETHFSYISEEPVAAASFGQVYRATTHDGLDVAVKVQRPHLRHVVVRDIFILRLGLGLLQKIAKRKSDPRLYADELGKGLVGELDYTLEAANASRFLEVHSPFKFIHVPKVIHNLSHKRVLTMEWMAGDNPNELLLLSAGNSGYQGPKYSVRLQADAKRRLLDLVNKGVEATLIQLLETGLLHADPHSGNLRYLPEGKIGFLDFGLLCQMEQKHQFAMLASIVHIVNGDWGSLVHALTEMDVVRPGTNIRRVTMDLEDALGEVEFKDGIPDVKFSRVLGKIWTVALKYHFRMPPYYTLLLRSLASLEGLAVAADKNFKTFDAAYPYVVRKLLTDNSAASRRILHSVVLNRRKEFQWQKLSLFLRVGATRQGLQRMIASDGETSLASLPEGTSGVFDVANLILRLLPSKEGVVLRRLLMTADGSSLVRAMVSKDGIFYRQQLCKIIADILYQWMFDSLGQGITPTQHNSRVASPINHYETMLRDRRLKVIFFKIMGSVRRDPVLMLRLCWTSLVMFMTASALACHRLVVALTEAYISPIPFAPKRVNPGSALGSVFSGFTRLCKGLAVVLIGGHVVVQIFPPAITYLALIPARTIPFGWNLLTAGYVEHTLYGVIINTIGLLFVGKLLEPIWGSKEFFKFIFIINFVTYLGVFITAVALYYITSQENYLYKPVSGFHGVIAGFLVGIKQIIPHQELPLVKLKAKWLPSLMLLLPIVASFFAPESVAYLPTLIFGTYMSWIYLRYFQRKPETKLKGDPSEEFAFSTFFPELLRPLIDPVASIFDRMLCGKSGTSSEENGYTLGGAPLPGSDPIEASRRRERGARALEERLAVDRLAAGGNAEESGRDAAENV
ncbi:TMEM115/Pdh1/Rbl19 [Dillenia turbinata]|uniref:TMEM115/Pdh1/Rbl19 n=1 Tax=Dillenia turbinata TaxID=194707 RepID=A0AAN8ZD18_9MAGN